ncbi:HD family phosphohydrolase [Paenibacillus thalictri]|nr:HDIG domain-containing metalloprotein [Paenibacillus thalictri]
MIGWKFNTGIRFLLFLAFALLFYFALMHQVVPQTYDIRLGSLAEKDILAPGPIPDAVATEKAKEEAAQKVGPVYKIVSLKNETLVEAIFEKLNQLNADTEVAVNDKVNIYRSVLPTIKNDFVEKQLRAMELSGQYPDTLIKEVRSKLAEQEYRIPEETFYKLPKLAKEDLAAMEPVAKDIVIRLMNDQLLDAQTARAKTAELVNASTLTKSISRELVQEMIRFAITPNKFLDQKGTDDAKGHARDIVKPVMINKNDILVKKGDKISEDMYQRLKSLDLLKEDANYRPHMGLGLLVLLFIAGLYMFVRNSRNPISSNNSQLVMLLLIFVVNIAGLKIISLGQGLDYPYIGFLAPAALGAMLITILLDAELALISAVIFGIMSSIVFNPDHGALFDYRFGLVTIVTSLAAIFSIQRASQRVTILRAGMMVSLFALLAVGAIMLLDDHITKKELIFALSFAVAGGLVTSVFVIGLLPFFEAVFGILSPLKLVELSNPNHPLLRKLLTETPGTYHHSIMVGNLAEAAAEAVGANGLLCRVGSYYHDIGKTKRPNYFIENQTNMENPHDRIEPALSKSIIVAHARDGVEMLSEYNIPKQLRDIAEQHHGTTLLQFFYYKAKKQAEEAGDKEVAEADFRYPGPKAQTKEAAIVGIADCIEAAVRSLRSPTLEQIDTMIRKIIKSRLDDGQFNECDLTLKELDLIAKTLNEALLGIFHSRIEYPNDVAPQKS